MSGMIGAGFASGQELTVFFVKYGLAGLMGICLAVLLLFVGTGLALQFCAKHGVSSYSQFLAVIDPKLSVLLDLLYALFLIVGVSVMFAGLGAIGETSLAEFFFRIGSAFMVFVALYGGVQGVLKVSGWLAPFLVVVLLVMAIHRLGVVGFTRPGSSPVGALEAGTLYACYNLGFAIAVLASSHQHLKTSKERWQLAFLGSVMLGVCMLVLYLALSTLTKEQLQGPFPLVHLLTNGGQIGRVLYKLMLLVAMYTTAVANSLALVSRITQVRSISWALASIAVVAVGVILSYFGFANLIRVAYPLLGLAGLWIVANLLRESMT